MQLLIQNATLRSLAGLQDIGIDQGRISGIISSEKGYPENQYDTTIDAKGSLVTESFASPHIHLDKTLIGESIVNESGTLWEAIEITWEYKECYTRDDLIQRASRIIDAQIRYGVTKFRTHVDVDSICGLVPLEGLLEVKKIYNDLIDLQIVAFPQEGILKDDTEERMIRAMEEGADVVGGMPHNEHTAENSIKHVNIIFDIAEKFTAPIDSHTDETDDPNSKTLEIIAAETIRRKFKYGVTADHCCALAAYDDYHAAKVIGLCKEAGINIITNPCTNMCLQGRLDKEPKRVGITRVKELVEAGVNVTNGQDCILDPYYPFGKGDMLEVALLTGHAAKMTLPQEIEILYDFCTKNAFKTMGLDNYELKPGSKADLVILGGVKTVWEAIRQQPPARTTIRAGKVISVTDYDHKKLYNL